MKNKNIFLISLLLLSSLFIYAEDYYWVGGTGIWSDLNSWRSVNGQIPNEVPDSDDNVIFNEYSFIHPFDTVFILTQNPVCKNMTWVNIQDTVVIKGGSNTTTFSIYGSLTLHPNIVNNYFGKIYFMSDAPGNTISCAGSRIAYDIYFKGNGEWILQDTLLMSDTIAWEAMIFGYAEPLDPNPVIFHENGTFRTNEHTIISRGFQSVTDKERAVYMANSHIYFAGNWALSGENNDFDASNTYINMRGEMKNFNGEVITYHDIDVHGLDGAIENKDIRTVMRKIHFLGSGSLDGEFKAGVEGSFTVDTVLFEGAFDPMTGAPIPCLVTGPKFYIHYAEVNQVDGHFEQRESVFHRIVFQGDDFGVEQWKSEFYGIGNVCDTVQFLRPRAKFLGDNIINNLLYFKTDATVSSWNPAESYIHHAVFAGDGEINGSNIFNTLTLNTGFRYVVQTDSLTLGSAYTNTNIQTINHLEVIGDCYQGMCTFVSDQKLVQAVLNYTGSNFTTEYIQVMDMRNIGTPIMVEYGIDLGNTEGFNFSNNHTPRTLYWVGGNGYWSDYEHWSIVPGQTPGDQCPPRMLDDVYFNALSGFNPVDTISDTAFVDIKHAYCNDMIWEEDIVGKPYFLSGYHVVDSILDTITQTYTYDTNLIYSDSCSLHLWGSLRFDTAMYNWFLGEYHFESQDDEDDDWETIDLRNGYKFPSFIGGDVVVNYALLNRVYFYGEGGKWEMESNLWNDVARYNFSENG